MGGPPFGGGGGGFGGPGGAGGVGGPSGGAGPPMFVGGTGSGQAGSRLTPQEEEEAITEMALHDHAATRGSTAEEFYRPRIDAATAENMRNRAMQEFMQRKAEMDRQLEEQKRRPPPGSGEIPPQ